MLKGNHDYFWNSLKKLNEFVKENEFENIEFLHNNSFEVEGKIIVRNKRMGSIRRRGKQKNTR